MTDARLFGLELLSRLRRSSRSPESSLSSFWLLLLISTATGVVLWLLSLQLNQDSLLAVFYGIALFELLLGLRSGFVRIGSRSDEYMLPVATRFWRRAFPYLLPAFFLPLPFVIAGAVALGGGWIAGIIFVKAAVTNYLMFFAAAQAASMLIRRISRSRLARFFLLALSVIALLSILRPGSLVFSAIFTYQEIGDWAGIFVVVAQLAVIVFSVALGELALGGIGLARKEFGRFYPLLSRHHLPGGGQGSSSFFTVNRLMLRDSALHRRLALVVLSTMAVFVVIAALPALTGLAFGLPGLIGSLAVFSAVSAFVIAKLAAEANERRARLFPYLPLEEGRLRFGSWFASLVWQLGFTALLWGLGSTAFGLGEVVAPILLVAGATQHTLVFGWSQKLYNARHHTLANVTVFLLTALVGILPVALLPLAGLSQTLFIQLIWLVLVVILLQLTRRNQLERNYA